MKLAHLAKQFESAKLEKSHYIDAMYKHHQSLYEYIDYIKQTDISKIEITQEGIIMTIKPYGVKLTVNTLDKRTTPLEVLNFRSFEKNEFPMLLSLLKKNYNFFDVGANIGWVSLNAAKIITEGKIFAFEPIPSTYNRLKDNIKLNKVKNVFALNMGFSKSSEDLVLYFDPKDAGSTSAANLYNKKSIKKITCSMRTMDDFVKEKKVKVDFIKCDVEGAEIFVLQGGFQTLEKYKPILFVEMLRKWTAKFKYTPNDTLHLLRSIGYECYTVEKDRLKKFGKMTEETVRTNFFFLHTKKHKKEIETYTKKATSI